MVTLEVCWIVILDMGNVILDVCDGDSILDLGDVILEFCDGDP